MLDAPLADRLQLRARDGEQVEGLRDRLALPATSVILSKVAPLFGELRVKLIGSATNRVFVCELALFGLPAESVATA